MANPLQIQALLARLRGTGGPPTRPLKTDEQRAAEIAASPDHSQAELDDYRARFGDSHKAARIGFQ